MSVAAAAVDPLVADLRRRREIALDKARQFSRPPSGTTEDHAASVMLQSLYSAECCDRYLEMVLRVTAEARGQ